ncbi:MAG: hypothetical protein AB2421_17200 [Thermotaleaceae bacterium]
MLQNNILLPLLLFMMVNREGKVKLSSDELYRINSLLKAVKPYFNPQHRLALTKTENIVDVVHGLSRYNNNDYGHEDLYTAQIAEEERNPIRLLEAVRPYIRGKGGEHIDKVLLLNDRVHRLRNRTAHPQKVMEDIESVTDILEILQVEKGIEFKKAFQTARQMMAMLQS